MSIYSLSGRAIRLRERMGGNGKGKFVRYGITCTAGLLVNMVRKTMEFVEPELPSEEYLKGYSVRETLTFADVGEFEAGMKRLFRTWAREKLPEDRPLYFNAACRIAEKEEAVEFWGDGVGCSIAKEEDFLRAVRLVREGAVTLEGLCRTLSVKDRRAFLLRQKFQYLYEKGCVRWSGHSRLFCLRHNGRLYYRASNLVGGLMAVDMAGLSVLAFLKRARLVYGQQFLQGSKP